jgi:phosphoenolpyruvate carboxykinase (ATP)
MGSDSSIESTFSTCFGAPFFPRPAGVYADLLMKRVESYNSRVFLVNTGWTGGPYGTGSRFSIPTTRRIVNAIQNGELDNVETQHILGLNLNVPKNIEGVDSALLNPLETWESKEDYQMYLDELVKKFQQNFKKFDVGHDIISAGPKF